MTRPLMCCLLGLVAGTGLVGCQRAQTTGHPAPVSSAEPAPAGLIVPAIEPLDPAKTKDPVAALFDRAIRAFGGPASFQRWRCGHMVYQSKSPLPAPAPVPVDQIMMEEFFDYPGKFKRIMTVTADSELHKSVWCYTPDKAWRQIGDRLVESLPTDAKVTGRQDHLLLDMFNLPVMQHSARFFTFSGPASVNGHPAWIIKWNGKKDRTDAPQFREAAFDQKTFLLLRTRSHVDAGRMNLLANGANVAFRGLAKSLGREVDSVVTFGVYEKVGDGMVPMHIVGTANGREFANIWIHTLEFRDHLADSFFE